MEENPSQQHSNDDNLIEKRSFAKLESSRLRIKK